MVKPEIPVVQGWDPRVVPGRSSHRMVRMDGPTVLPEVSLGSQDGGPVLSVLVLFFPNVMLQLGLSRFLKRMFQWFMVCLLQLWIGWFVGCHG